MELELVQELSDAQARGLTALYQDAWWAKGRSLDDVRAMLAHTDFVFAFVTRPGGDLVGFTRVLSDHVYFALIFDVIVAPAYRGQGIGTRLIEAVMRHPVVAQVRNVELCCRDDMQAFYERFGFAAGTGRMQIRQRRGGDESGGGTG